MNAAGKAVWLCLVFAPATGQAQTGLSLSEAIQQALTSNPAIQIQRAGSDLGRGRAQVARAQFDWFFDAEAAHRADHLPISPDLSLSENSSAISIGLSKRFGWGMSIEPTIELERGAGTISTVGGSTLAPHSMATVNLRIVQPLLRDFGAASSAEYEAELLLAQAAEHDLQQTISERVFVVAAAYWRYVEALRSLEVLAAAEKRSEQILKDAQELVAADERPKADLEQLRASLSDRTRGRLSAEQQIYESRSALALEMGLGQTELAAPSTALPEIAAADFDRLRDSMVKAAIERRQDLAGAKIRASAAQLIVGRAENQSLPQLDLIGDVGYSTLIAGDGPGDLFAAAGSNVPGVNARIALALRWPIGNLEARGQLQQAAALLRQAEIARDDLQRRIGAGVGTSIARLKTSLRSLERSKDSALHYQAAVTNERTKLKSGLSTVIDVVLTEDLLTGAQLRQISDHAAYAEAMARLAFEAGLLTIPDGESAKVDTARLIAPPAGAR